MVIKAIRLVGFGFGFGLGVGLGVDRLAAELRKPSAEQFPWLRDRMNRQVNPWLFEHGIPGGAKAEIATLEHVGRTSGTAYFTPVHPSLHEDTVLIPAPLGVGSQWARNVLHAGRARMQLHEHLYELARPELITVTETGMFPPPVAASFDRMGWRYVRLHVTASVPATFGTHESSAPHDRPAFDSSLGAPVDIPMDIPMDIPAEPRMVTREASPA